MMGDPKDAQLVLTKNNEAVSEVLAPRFDLGSLGKIHGVWNHDLAGFVMTQYGMKAGIKAFG